LTALKTSFKDKLTAENRLLRDLSQCELEIEGLDQAKLMLQNQMQDSTTNGESLKQGQREAKRALDTINQHIKKAEDDTS
jgi:chromosome segregation ATPase|tara:strand:+ start:424 stop:663 length:240 start_codon:yes stop_codon:yes gene_type:complete